MAKAKQNKSSKICFVYTTFPKLKEAKSVCEKLINEKLIACANIHPEMVSMYKWKGELEIGDEVSAILKTSPAKLSDLVHRLREIHPYEVPCITVLGTHFVNEEYSDWLVDSMK